MTMNGYSPRDLFSVPVGSLVSVDASVGRVTGKFIEQYIHSRGLSTAYVLSLKASKDEMTEIAAERNERGWHFWQSVLIGDDYPISEYPVSSGEAFPIASEYVVEKVQHG